MVMLIDKEVRFDKYCHRCKHRDVPEWEDPCDECLQYPSNEFSHKPVYFEERSDNADRR